MHVGDRIVALLKARDWNQADLARKLNISRAAVSRWVQGEDMSMEMLRRTAQVLGVAESELVSNDPEAPSTGAPDDETPRTAMAAS